MKLNLKVAITSIVVGTIFAGCLSSSNTQVPNQIGNKQKVVELLHSLETRDPKPVEYINPNRYIQHNLAIKDGISGLAEVLQAAPKGSIKSKVYRVFQDGKYVFAHTKYNFYGKKVGFDIFKFEDGKIVEHWDNLQAIVEKTANGRTQLDGPTKVKDIDKTKENKQLVKNLIDDVFLGKNPAKITQYISTKKYIQHNPHVKDGLKGLSEALEALAKAGMPMVYKKNHMILGEGNFVLAVSEGEFMKKHVSFYDLFRIEDGKVIEHWDTIQEIPSKDKWQNKNGKF